MKSDKAKVLHCLHGRPMVLYVVETAKRVVGENIVIVTGHQAEQVRDTISEFFTVRFAIQEKQLGTGHAVKCALPEIPVHIREIVILCGDVPLVTEDTLIRLIDSHRGNHHDITVLVVEVDIPTGYGRVIVGPDGGVEKIVEEADATEEERRVKTINSGIYCVNREQLEKAVLQIRPENKQNEFYLTDIVGIGKRTGMKIGVLVGTDPDEVIGINSPQDLEMAGKLLEKRKGKIT